MVDGEQKTAHDYAAYHASCAKVLDEEMRKADFQKALDAFSKDMAGIDGPMNPDRVSQDFLARRLLDKFMFHEGHFLREQTKRGPEAA